MKSMAHAVQVSVHQPEEAQAEQEVESCDGDQSSGLVIIQRERSLESADFLNELALQQMFQALAGVHLPQQAVEFITLCRRSIEDAVQQWLEHIGDVREGDLGIVRVCGCSMGEVLHQQEIDF